MEDPFLLDTSNLFIRNSYYMEENILCQLIESETPAAATAGVSGVNKLYQGLVKPDDGVFSLYNAAYFMSTYFAEIQPRSVLYHASAMGTSVPCL